MGLVEITEREKLEAIGHLKAFKIGPRYKFMNPVEAKALDTVLAMLGVKPEPRILGRVVVLDRLYRKVGSPTDCELVKNSDGGLQNWGQLVFVHNKPGESQGPFTILAQYSEDGEEAVSQAQVLSRPLMLTEGDTITIEAGQLVIYPCIPYHQESAAVA